MLLVFAFANTPKRFLHNLVANHKDTYSKKNDRKTEVSKSVFYCQWDNIVATSPFIVTDEKPEIRLVFTFISHQEKTSLSNLFPAHTYFKLRGPPHAILSI